MTILYGILIFWAGVFAGYLLNAWVTYKFRYYSGTLLVDVDSRDKTVYSLILDEYPEELRFKKAVIFKVGAGTSEESSDRK